MNHIVYFIGGPLDLTKRAYPGDHPQGRRLRFPTPSLHDRAVFHDTSDPIALTYSEVEYDLTPIYHNRAGRPIAWVAVFVE